MQMMVRPPVVMVLAVVLVGAAAACTKRNPEACCSTPVECEVIGFDDITPCLGLLVCVGGTCEAPQCATSAECTGSTPYCVDQICSASCTESADCDGIAGLPHCAPAGSCVACLDSTHCSGATPVCDTATNACVPCAADSECASGICLAAEGTCAAEADAVYVSMGGTDAGECIESAPCLTLAYALPRITAIRRVLRIVSLDYTDVNGLALAQDVYVDGANTRLQRTSVGAVITVSTGVTVTIEGVRVVNPVSLAMNVVAGTATLYGADIGGSITSNGRLNVFDSDVDYVTCQNSYLTIERSRLASVSSSSCVVAVSRSRLNVGEGTAVGGSFSALTFENNLAISDGTFGTALRVQSAPLGSTIRYNTFVKGPAGADDANALLCTGPTVATSNIFAWRSTEPIGAGSTCDVRFSLFDLDGVPAPGLNNRTQAFDSIFIDAAAGDFHPSATSMALGAAEPGLGVIIDHAGSVRPQPAATEADIGAFEAP